MVGIARCWPPARRHHDSHAFRRLREAQHGDGERVWPQASSAGHDLCGSDAGSETSDVERHVDAVAARVTLEDWHGPLPRLAYITDKGSACDEYYHDVLKKMKHPRDGKLLAWEWVLDFWRVCSYIGKMADALFGGETKAGAVVHQDAAMAEERFEERHRWHARRCNIQTPQDDQAAKRRSFGRHTVTYVGTAA